VGCAIQRAAISFGFDNYAGNAFSVSGGNDEKFAKQFASDGDNVRAGVKRALEFKSVHRTNNRQDEASARSTATAKSPRNSKRAKKTKRET